MSKSDTETIVKDFLNLWQKQFSHISRDGEAMSKNIEAFAQMQQAYESLMGAGGNKNAKSAAASDILKNIGNEFVRLSESYAKLERRIAELESGAAIRRKTSPKKATREKTTRATKRTK